MVGETTNQKSVWSGTPVQAAVGAPAGACHCDCMSSPVTDCQPARVTLVLLFGTGTVMAALFAPFHQVFWFEVRLLTKVFHSLCTSPPAAMRICPLPPCTM